MKRVYVNEQWCLGCHLCEYYCAFANTREKDMARALKDVKINPKINIEEKDGVSFAVSCRHCNEPLCVKGCITGALSREDGVITIDKEKCVSCYTCVLCCPYGAISPSEDGAVQKCELCVKNTLNAGAEGRGVPVCVKGCPNGAIVFEEREETTEPVTRADKNNAEDETKANAPNNTRLNTMTNVTDNDRVNMTTPAQFGTKTNTPTRYVIIGNSAAGIGAAEGIRQADKNGAITIITSEPHHTYSRPLISYYLLGKTDAEHMRYRDISFYKNNNCKLLTSVTATRIDPVRKYVELEDGNILPYDKLLTATGSAPFIPTFKGLETVSEVFTFMCLDDALRLNDVLTERKRVLIIGAGLIGLKCAEGIIGKASQVTVLDMASRILSSILDEDGAEMVRNHLAANGIECKLSANIEYFDYNKAVLSNGETVPFDVLVLAVGVRPNTSLLSGIADIGRGIVVNAKSETTAEDIYAAGDCTETADIIDGVKKVMALLPNAYMQGECAGINMAGGDCSFDRAIPMNAIGFMGLHMITAGHYTGDAYAETGENRYKRLFHSDGRLNGYILIGDIEKAGIYTSLIRERTPLDTIDFSLICEKPGLMAFTKTDRTKRLNVAAQQNYKEG